MLSISLAISPTVAKPCAQRVTFFEVRVPPLGFVGMSLIMGDSVVIPDKTPPTKLADERSLAAVT